MEGSCAVRLVQPLLAYASTRADLQDLAPPGLATMDPDARLPLRLCHDGLVTAAERLGRPDLGLTLGADFRFGRGGVFDFAVRSAPTVREALAVANRFSKLMAAPLRILLETRERQSIVRLDDDIPWPRVIADFALGAWYRAHAVDEIPAAARPECWFPYAAPAERGGYERAFPGAVLKFDAPLLGVVFDRRYEDAPMPVSDPLVHAMICTRADALLHELAGGQQLTLSVRKLVAEDIRDGEAPTIDAVARRLHMSPRTVSRKLEQERTTFASELDSARRDYALTLVRQPHLALTDVAFRAGFSHAESFYRAFRRWTGSTPQAYRSAGRVA